MIPTAAVGPMLDVASRAPEVTLDELAPGGTVLVVSPHPDDETLGCGTAIAAAADAGLTVLVLLLTDGEGSHRNSPSVSEGALRRMRRGELDAALTILTGGRELPVLRLGLPDGHSAVDLIEGDCFDALLRTFRRHDVRSVWTTWAGDPHIDHRTAATLARDLARLLRVDFWSYPVWGRFSNEPFETPNLRRFVCPDDEFADRKRRALSVYRTQFDAAIDDDPDGFIMPPPLLEHFATFDEIFIRG